ncbi:hypothetical protein OAK15_03165 [Verrucomicrobia bacterium]|nr:hypothetical protein [Verrucomicrobiota bacterium]
MKRIIFADRCANRDQYILAVPEKMIRWRVSALYDYLQKPQSLRGEYGYIPTPLDSLHFEQFRQLIVAPELTMSPTPILIQNGEILGGDAEIVIDNEDIVVDIDREDTDFSSITGKVSVAKRNIMAFESCRAQICNSIDKVLDLDGYPVTTRKGGSLQSFSEIVEFFNEELDEREKLRLLWRLSRILYAAPFESITRIIDNRQSRPGYAVWRNIANGFGGVCAEKTAALGFVCDILGMRYSPVLGSAAGLPENYEKQLLGYARSGGELDSPAWVQHHLLEVELANEIYLIDTTNGNIPFIFLTKSDSESALNGGMRARMVYNTERIQLRRSTSITGDILLTLGEFHIPDLHLQYIFEQGLGIQISAECFLGVYFDWGGERSALQQNYYSSMARKVGFPYPRFLHQSNLESLPDEGLCKVLQEVLVALRERYCDSSYTGDFTFVLQPINNNFWREPRISSPVIECLGIEGGLLTRLMGSAKFQTRSKPF